MSRKFYFSRDAVKSFLAGVPALQVAAASDDKPKTTRVSVMSVDHTEKFEKFPVIISYDLDLDMIIVEEDLE